MIDDSMETPHTPHLCSTVRYKYVYAYVYSTVQYSRVQYVRIAVLHSTVQYVCMCSTVHVRVQSSPV